MPRCQVRIFLAQLSAPALAVAILWHTIDNVVTRQDILADVTIRQTAVGGGVKNIRCDLQQLPRQIDLLPENLSARTEIPQA